MLKRVSQNPYRILGVCANASAKDRIANKNRLNAFARVGRSCTFPMDLPEYFGTLSRSSSAISFAEQQINLDIDKLRHALFWFVQVTPLDNAALSNLTNNNKVKAIEILIKKDCFSSLLNRAIIAYSDSNIGEAVRCTTMMLNDEHFFNEFVQEVSGENIKIDAWTLAEYYINSLADELGWKQVYNIFKTYGVSSKYDKYIAEKLVGEPIKRLSELVEKYEKINDEDELKFSCDRLINESKSDLAFVDQLLDEKNNQRRSIHDKVANEISSLAARYYKTLENPSDWDFSSIKGHLITAISIAVGEIEKNSLKEAIENLDSAREGARKAEMYLPIATAVKEFAEGYHTLDDVEAFVNKVVKHISTIPASQTEDSEYIELSSVVAGLALGAVIKVVNDAQSSQDRIRRGLNDGTLRTTFSRACNIIEQLKHIKVNDETRERIATNSATIQKTYNQILQIGNQIKNQSSSGSCYIATMVYGDYDHPNVKVLREFRDQVLAKFYLGRLFIDFYYKYSPALVVKLWKNKKFNMVAKFVLDVFVSGYRYVK